MFCKLYTINSGVQPEFSIELNLNVLIDFPCSRVVTAPIKGQRIILVWSRKLLIKSVPFVKTMTTARDVRNQVHILGKRVILAVSGI